MGTFDELITSEKDFAKLLTSSSGDKDKDEKPLPMSRKTSARVRHKFIPSSNMAFAL